MAAITLRPDIRTSGGEVTELLLDGRFAGAITLVYREGDRISGSVQLDSGSLSANGKAEAVRAAQQYVQQMMDALRAKQCEVVVTYSSYDHIMAAEHQVGVIESFVDDPYEQLDIDPFESGMMEMAENDWTADPGEPFYYELVIVGENRNQIEYHLYDEDRQFLAEAFIRLRGSRAEGEIDWQYEPLEEEIEHAADLLLSDFDDDQIDALKLNVNYDGEWIETIELTRDDLLDDEGEDPDLDLDMSLGDELLTGSEDRDYSAILVRDDGDTLTYDLYERSHGGYPVGQATVDISSRELTGFIDFRDELNPDAREQLATLLMQELDKEKDYESFNVTMLVNNEPIDELMFETETYH